MSGLYRLVPSVEFEFDSSGNPVINTDSPDAIRKHLNFTYSGLVLCLLWNVIAVSTLWIQDGLETTTLLLPIIVFVIGVPAAYLSWYRELYIALMAEKAKTFSFKRFSLFFYFHFVYCLLAGVGAPVTPDGKSFTGLLSTLIVSAEDHGLPEIFYWFGLWLFSVESALSFSLMHRLLRALAWPYAGIGEDMSVAQKNQLQRRLFLAWLSMTSVVIVIMVVAMR